MKQVVTVQDVQTAMDIIERQGLKPTLDRIIDSTGGSKTTILKLRKVITDIKGNHGTKHGTKHGTNSTVSMIKESVNHQMETLKKELLLDFNSVQAQNAQLQEKMVAMETKLGKAQADNEVFKQQVSALQAKINSFSGSGSKVAIAKKSVKKSVKKSAKQRCFELFEAKKSIPDILNILTTEGYRNKKREHFKRGTVHAWRKEWIKREVDQ